jgi:hypothetical protein
MAGGQSVLQVFSTEAARVVIAGAADRKSGRASKPRGV